MRPYRCVKCAESHNTTDCPKQDRTEPAKCALCLGDHAANYKGCKVFQEIQKRKFGSRPQPRQKTTSQNEGKASVSEETMPPTMPNTNRTYAQATAGTSTSLEAILTKQAEKLDRLIEQMGTLMGLLSTIVTKLVH